MATSDVAYLSTSARLAAAPSVTLDYSIAGYSSYSGVYEPTNVLVDRPQDLSSRWSGASVATASSPSPSSGAAANPLAATGGAVASSSRSALSAGLGPVNGKQFIILKLAQPAVVKSVLFGKFHKPHPCNLRDFKVYGGPSPDPASGLWMRLLRAGLRNDAASQDFVVKHTDREGTPFPVHYIKVVPLAAHSPNYNFSVWHIVVRGVADPPLVAQISHEYEEACESTTTRLVLKHLRARGHQAAFEALLSSSKLDAPHAGSVPPGSLPRASQRVQRSSRRPFEHPIVTQLYEAMLKGDWSMAEACLEQAASADLASEEAGLFASYVSQCSQGAHWTRLNATDADGDVPSPRGGHQLVVDSQRGTAYLFGGWNGKEDLNDLWIYHISEGRWRCISRDTRLQGGPGPRSCHKIAYDSRSGLIYVLGRYVDYDRKHTRPTEPLRIGSTSPAFPNASEASPLRPPNPTQREPSDMLSISLSAVPSLSYEDFPPTNGRPAIDASLYYSDFYRFSTRNERWDRLSGDTSRDGGPKLIFDHQMVVDEEGQMLYVFGGRVAHWDPSRLELSGMWRYDCIQRTWTFIFDDDTRSGGKKIPSRTGHSMLLDAGAKGSNKRLLWVLAGQRAETYLADMYTFDIVTGAVREVAHDYHQTAGGPEGGFTQRATIDSHKREIHLFSGLTRRGRGLEEKSRSAFWTYSIEKHEWKMLWQSGSSSHLGDVQASLDVDLNPPMAATDEMKPSTSSTAEREPRPRYAAQMAYDDKTGAFLLFGGNPADAHASDSRLDDLWMLRLIRPEVSEILRSAKFALRQQIFREMAAAASQSASLDQRVGCPQGASSTAMDALMYLQTEVAAVVNHDAAEESKLFRSLVAGLFSEATAPIETSDSSALSEGRSPVDSDGLPAVDDDSDMLSISQTLPSMGSKTATDFSRALSLDPTQSPPPLLQQRLDVYKQLLRFFPAEAVEPAEDLPTAVGAFFARTAGRS